MAEKKKITKKKAATKKKVATQKKRIPVTEAERIYLTGKGKVGRPRMYNTVDEFNAVADEYFNKIDELESSRKPTITGIALYMGFANKVSLYEYGENPKFTYSVNSIRAIIENAHENRLFTDRPSGSQFALSCMGWHATTETINTNKNLTIEI